MQNYTREKIPELIELNQQEPECKEQLKIFFGAYVPSPKAFEFTQGNRKLIKAIIKRINDTIADSPTEQDGLAIWNMQIKGKWWKNLCQTSWGLFYGDTEDVDTNFDASGQSKKHGKKKRTNLEQLKKDLFSKAKKVSTSYMMKLSPVCEFSSDLISVKIVNGVTVEGIITCNFCKDDSLVKKVKVFYQQTTNCGHWVISNYSRHFTKHHKNGATANSFPKKRASKSIEENELNRSLTLKIEHVVENSNKTEELDYSEFEDFLYLQMSRQNIELVNTTLHNEEDIIDFYVKVDLDDMTSSKHLKICRIDGDGSCLFSSLIHQLTFCSIGTAIHKKETRMLRQECVEHIESNFDRYLPFLESRIIEESEKCPQSNVDACDMNTKCREFLKTLTLTKTYGGVETIKAVSELRKVNIITIKDDGTCNLVHLLNEKFDRSIFVAYSNGNHYDSIAEIDTETVSAFARNLAINHAGLTTKIPILIE